MPMYISEITFWLNTVVISQSVLKITQSFCNTLIQKSIGKPLVKSDESKMLGGSFKTSFSSIFNSISDMPSSSCPVKSDFRGLTRPSKNNF